MSKLTPTQKAVCRTPSFSLQTTLEEAWPTLKLMIADASPDLYSKISDLDAEDIQHQPEKIRYTIWKYFNRSRYRATPFGRFASVSLVPISTYPVDNIALSKEMDIHQWADWTSSADDLKNAQEEGCMVYRTNPTVYLHDGDYRYIAREEGRFALHAIAESDEVSAVLQYCKTARHLDDIARYLKEHHAVSRRQSRCIVADLVEVQVVQHSHLPNITGDDYFERVGVSPGEGTLPYTMASRKVLGGGISKEMCDQIADYVHFAGQCFPQKENHDLENFKKNFTERWENQSIPLTLALDPMVGVRYGDSMQISEMPLIESLKASRSHSENQLLRYGAFEQFLLNGILSEKSVHLEEFETGDKGSTARLPNTLSVQLHVYDGKPVIHMAGGASATALLGRFTHLPEFRRYSKSLTDIEQEANPEVVFFDLAYECEGKVDNINRRQHLYETELAFGGWSTIDAPIPMVDVMVSVVQNEIILHHRQRGDRLIPRLASAYNYSRSDLPHFRFLCDLQHQQIKSVLNIDLAHTFPKLQKYPRVYYKDCIVCPAQWQVPLCSSLEEMQNWFAEQQIDKPFTIGAGDQTLLFDPKVATDMEFLFRYQKQYPYSYITEALLSDKQLVKDQQDRPYRAEFILDFYHTQAIYSALPLQKENLLERQIFQPGEEWLYLELYLHPVLADDVLREEINSLLRTHRQNLLKWFFIRYSSPEDHLRLRLRPKDDQRLSLLLADVAQVLKSARKSGRVHKILMKEYDREVHRYGEEQMDLVEQFFHEDSEAALIELNTPEVQRYGSCMAFIQILCRRLYPDEVDQSAYYRRSADSFAKEMTFTNHDFKRINQEYRNHHGIKISGYKKRLQYFDKIMDSCSLDKRKHMLADLCHMHINRRFAYDQRLHEAVIYQYLYKQSLSINARVAHQID